MTAVWFHREMTDLSVLHDSVRPLMFSIAYRMLGSVADAEDVVQDALLRMHDSDIDVGSLRSPDAFATTVTTRLAIDALRSARRRREEYVGQWLPEPLAAEDENPAHRVELDETVSIAFLTMLERLTPTERAVLVLREAFGYDYDEIAAIVDKSPQACRQLFSRARRHLEAEQPRFRPDRERSAELAAEFFAAVETGDVARLEQLLAEDVRFIGDGGGKRPALARPVSGPVQVARLLGGLVRQAERQHYSARPTTANGMPALLLLDPHGSTYGVMALDIIDGRIQNIFNQINPDKLLHLGGDSG